MVHSSLRSLGPVVGGANTVVQALLDAVGEEGNLFAYVDFEAFFEDDDPEIPVFDKRIAPAARDHGVLHEALRIWPGALRSDHPDAGVVALGPRAEWLIKPHPFQYGYGTGTPLARFVELDGKVLMLGAPLDRITLLHYAEHCAQIPDKRICRYRRLMPGQIEAIWVDFEEFETDEPVHEALPSDCFAQIAEAALRQGIGLRHPFAAAEAHLFPARPLVDFAIRWIERHVLGPPPR